MTAQLKNFDNEIHVIAYNISKMDTVKNFFANSLPAIESAVAMIRSLRGSYCSSKREN